jgi:hypothetical protein
MVSYQFVEIMGFKNCLLRWIPYVLTNDLTKERVDLSIGLLQLLETNGEWTSEPSRRGMSLDFCNTMGIGRSGVWREMKCRNMREICSEGGGAYLCEVSTDQRQVNQTWTEARQGKRREIMMADKNSRDNTKSRILDAQKYLANL